MNRQLTVLLLFFCVILILQEGGSGQSINTQFSVFMYSTPLWVLFVSTFSKLNNFSLKNETSFFKDLLLMYTFLFVGQSLIVLVLTKDKFSGPLMWNIVRLFSPLISVFLITILHNGRNTSIKSYLASVDIIFIACIIALSSKLLYTPLSSINIVNILFLGISPFESDTLCFAFGLLSAHYVINKEYRKLIFCVFFVLLSGKRIVFIALIIFFILNLNPVKRIVLSKMNFFGVALLLINLSYAYFLYDMGSGDGYINDLLESFFSKSTNEITVGRVILYERIIDKLGFPKSYGYGMGRVIYTLRKISPNEEWLHSDVLMNFYEVGLVGGVYWMYFMFKKFKESYVIFSLLVIYDIYMLTDNAFYYFAPTFVFYYLVFINLTVQRKLTF